MTNLILNFWWVFWALLLTRPVRASQSFIYDLTADQYHDNCFFITNLNHSFIEYKDPYISVHLMVKQFDNDKGEKTRVDYEINVILLNEKDVLHTSIKDTEINHCTPEMVKEHKCEAEKLGVIDVQEEVKHAVLNVMLLTNGANLLVYPILETGWYCTFVKIHPFSSNDAGLDFPIRFEIQQSIGELSVHGYEDLETGILMFLLYLAFGAGYYYYNYKFTQGLDMSDYSLLVKVSRFQKLQNLLYKYCVFNAVLYLVTVLRYSVINVTTYNHDYVLLKLFQFFELVSNTVFTTWIVYEILLFSDGYNLINNKKNSLVNIITTRLLTLVLFISFVIFDLESSSIFSIQSYLSDFFRPFTQQNELNLSISQVGGWMLYAILLMVVVKILLNCISTINMLRYRNSSRLIKRFSLTIALILMTPVHMFVLLPMLNSLEISLGGGLGYFWSSKYFVYTLLPFGTILNFLNFGLVCYIWKGTDLVDDLELQSHHVRDGVDDEEEEIELTKL